MQGLLIRSVSVEDVRELAKLLRVKNATGHEPLLFDDLNIALNTVAAFRVHQPSVDSGATSYVSWLEFTSLLLRGLVAQSVLVLLQLTRSSCFHRL